MRIPDIRAIEKYRDLAQDFDAALSQQFWWREDTGLWRGNIPAPRTESDDHNPQRIAPRNLFDVSVGHDNLFRGDKYRWSLRFTVINLTNKTALYNYFSTFSGTHYVTPRSETAELGFHF
ncbi:MAG TPA: hypothetical protein VGF19_03115 [Candidatus Acidoferrum sp.]